jgi:RNA polymerase sigma-70 factor (ECF subfamily)
MGDVDTDERIATAWQEHRGYVLAVASRILADPAEAEDVVQDAFARLAVQRVEEIDDLRAWLVVVVRRLALDRLGSARHRLSRPSDPHDLPPASADGLVDPADRITLDDEVRRALGVVLDLLSPAERAAFLLHDVFGIPFERIAEIVGRSPVACRQLASRARRSIRGTDPAVPHHAPDPELEALVDRFIAACAGDDLEGLARTLHPDVEGWATVDGERVGWATGVDKVAVRMLFFWGPRSGCTLVPLPLEDGTAILATRDGEPVAVARVRRRDGGIGSLHTVLLPALVASSEGGVGEVP